MLEPEMVSIRNSFNMDFSQCPVCKGRVVRRCKTPLLESECSQNHVWHICLKHDTLMVGPVLRTISVFACHCYPNLLERDLLAI